MAKTSKLLTQHRFAGRASLIEPAYRRRVRGTPRDLWILLRLPQYLGDDRGESVERLTRLSLGRFDQQRLIDEQREVNGRRMNAVVQKSLGQVERPDPQLTFHRRPREHDLVHAHAVVRGWKVLQASLLSQTRKQVVGVEHRHL